MAAPLVAAAATVALGVFAALLQGHTTFAPGACDRLEPFLQSHIVGQELAIRQFADATCDLLRRQQQSGKPLIISAHGPPGVGKSLTHWLAAKALYNTDPLADDRCPGHACAGYKVMYGMDYVSTERQEQHQYLRAALLDHLRRTGQALLVIEEYDKLDCATRAMFRQLFENLHAANVTNSRPIILLESNTGYTQLHQMLVKAGDRSKVSPEEAQRVLKDLIFSIWSADGCESRTETLKMVSMIDFFLPYLPLERSHIRRLFEMRLAEEADLLRKAQSCRLTWDDAVLNLLVSKVDFEGDFPIEGAKEVSTVMTRHVSRLLRPWLARHSTADSLQASRQRSVQQWKDYFRSSAAASLVTGGRAKRRPEEVPAEQLLRLKVAAGGKMLELEPHRTEAA